MDGRAREEQPKTTQFHHHHHRPGDVCLHQTSCDGAHRYGNRDDHVTQWWLTDSRGPIGLRYVDTGSAGLRSVVAQASVAGADAGPCAVDNFRLATVIVVGRWATTSGRSVDWISCSRNMYMLCIFTARCYYTGVEMATGMARHTYSHTTTRSTLGHNL